MFNKIKARVIAFIERETKKALAACDEDFKTALADYVVNVFDAERKRFEAQVALFKGELATIEKELREKFVATLKAPADLLKGEPDTWQASAEDVAADHKLKTPWRY